MFQDLLEPSYGINDSPIDNTKIVQVILYFDEKDSQDVRMLAKELMKHYLPDTYEKEGNLSDLYLTLLKEKYEQINKSEAVLHRPAGGTEVEGNVPGSEFI